MNNFNIVFLLAILILGISVSHASNNLYLNSGYKIVKESAFVLTPDDVRRIYSVFDGAKSKYKKETAIVFGVIRKDRRFYETTNIEDVLNDPNVEGREIVLLNIELNIVDPEILDDPRSKSNVAYVEFDGTPKPRITIKVSSDDRNWALAMSDELEPQVERVINKKKTSIWLLALVIIPLLVLLFRIKYKLKEDSTGRIIVSIVANPTLIGITIGFAAATYSIWSENETYRMLFGPIYGFSWGNFSSVIADWSNTRNNVFWVVVIGIPLSIAINFLSSFSRKPDESTVNEDENG